MSRAQIQPSLLAPGERKSTGTVIDASISSRISSSNFAIVNYPLLINGKLTFWKLTIYPSINCLNFPMSRVQIQPSLLAPGERKSTATVIVTSIFSRISSFNFASVNVPLLIHWKLTIGS
jgi:hypothetical protein